MESGERCIKILSVSKIQKYDAMARFPSELDGSLLDLDLLPLNPGSVSAALKGEVGLVQGKRRRKRRPWNYNYGCGDGVEVPFEESGGGGDPGTKVTKLCWKILKTSPTPPSSAKETTLKAQVSEIQEKNDTRQKAKRLLQGFYMKYGVDIQFSQEDSSLFTQHPTSAQEKQQTHSKSGGGEEKQPEKSSFSSHQDSGRASGAGGTASGSGAGGGDKRPPPPPSTTESERSLGETTSEEELTTDTSTTAVGGDIFPSLRKKLKRSSTEAHGGNQHHHHHHHHLRQKRPRITVENKEPGNILVHSFSTLGKPEKKSVIGLGKQLAEPFGKKKSIKPGARSFLHSERSSSISRKSHLGAATLASFSVSSSSSAHSSFSVAGKTEPRESSFLEVPTVKLKLGVLPRSTKKDDGSPTRTRQSTSGPDLVSNVRQVAKSIAKERDSEWLENSSNELDLTQKRESDKEKKPSSSSQESKPIQPNLKRFMESTRVLDRVNSIMGLNPYQKVVRSNQSVQVKWEPWSGEYLGVCLNAFLFVSCTASAFFTLVIIIGYSKPQSITHEIIQLEFINHFPETLFLVLFSIILCVWAIACVMELGIHYAELFSRFNLAICILKYDVTEGVHLLIVVILSSVGIFSVLMAVLFFSGEKTEIVRDTMGFLGYAILRPFNFRFRESIYYPFVQMFGLVIFLYFFLSLNVVLLQFAVYGKALGNMAMQFNLRLGYALGKLEEKEKRVKKVIPYEKLYAEHLIIVSLFRNLSQVNRVVFRTFLFSMICEIVLAVWLLFDMFLDAGHLKQGSYITQGGSGHSAVYLAVPVRVTEVSGEAILKSLTTFFFTMGTYWGFGGVMHHAAVKLQVGIDYIRRHGFIYAKTSKERRFIMSMVHSFTSKRPYYVGMTFHISRQFLLRLLGFVIISSMVTVSYRPSRTELTLIEQCNHDGFCLGIKLTKLNQYLFYVANDDASPPTTRKPTLVIIGPPTIDPTKPILNRFQSEIYLHKPPCVSHSNYPPLYATYCPASWSQVRRITLPYLYKPMLYGEDKIPIYGRLLFPFTSESEWKFSCPDPEHSLYGFPYDNEFGLLPSGDMVDCFGRYVQLRTSDDCGNLGWKTPDSRHEEPPLRLIAMNQLPEFDPEDERFFCCYQYKISAENEVEVCNMPDPTTLGNRCRFLAELTFIFRKYAKVLREERKTKDILASNVPFDDPERMRWTMCLCKKRTIHCEKPTPTTTTKKTTTTTKKPTTTTKKTTTTTTTVKPTTTTKRTTTTTKKPTTTTKKTTTTTTTVKPQPSDRPFCLDRPRVPAIGRLFTVCDVLSNSGKWEDLKTIFYPNVLKGLPGGRYIQHVPMGASNCVVKGEPQFPSENSEAFPSPPAFDCLEKKYIEVYPDDCNSPILTFIGVNNPQIRVTVWSKKYKLPEIRCCVDYGITSDKWGSRDRARVCNMPNELVFSEKCKATPTSSGVEALAFARTWNRNGIKREEMETAEISLKCCCWHLRFVKRKYPRDLSVPPGLTREEYCKQHFESL